MNYETRPHTYDETIKTLGKKDYVALAEFALPFVKDANEITLESINLSIPGMLKVDFIKEEILMKSALYTEPYEAGRLEGKQEGIQEGRKETEVKIALKLLIKQFGKISSDIMNKIKESDIEMLDILIDQFDQYKDLNEIRDLLN